MHPVAAAIFPAHWSSLLPCPALGGDCRYPQGQNSTYSGLNTSSYTVSCRGGSLSATSRHFPT
ncbi:hypothetical protein PR002_g13301 [Phytophthora rubi]|uniref:Uncharacterized protein n=1 Tax=Phytophthora rubi TaxID=129364 RepID=A0A6A3LEC4_9STRA|nr:hypothetical protein PR002_g13301 [Phytophthora rubi]